MDSRSSSGQWPRTSPNPNGQILVLLTEKHFGVRCLLDQLQTVVLNNFCDPHCNTSCFFLLLCMSFPSLGVPYHGEIWVCHLINTITAHWNGVPCAEHHPHTLRYLLLRQGNTKLYMQEMEKVKVNILAGGNIYGKNPWISELYSFHWHFLTALTFYISCGWLLFNMF